MTEPALDHLGITDDPGCDAPPDLRTAIQRDFSPIDGLGEVGGETTIRVFRLPFHDAVELVLATDPAWRPEGVWVVWLVEAGQFYRLYGSSPPIHVLNAKICPRLELSTILPYLRFFCLFVQGSGGPFLIVESTSNPFVPQENMEQIGDQIVPAEVLGQDAAGIWHAAAMVHYGDVLFASRFGIALTGAVDMIEDAPVVHDLPAKVRVPLGLSSDERAP